MCGTCCCGPAGASLAGEGMSVFQGALVTAAQTGGCGWVCGRCACFGTGRGHHRAHRQGPRQQPAGQIAPLRPHPGRDLCLARRADGRVAGRRNPQFGTTYRPHPQTQHLPTAVVRASRCAELVLCLETRDDPDSVADRRPCRPKRSNDTHRLVQCRVRCYIATSICFAGL